MAELAFVGLGLGDERGLSARAWDVLRAAEEVFAEEYTAVAPDGTLDRVSAELHRRVQPLDRSLLESERPILDALDRSARVALIVVGDPFAATTHVALRLAVERAGHDLDVRAERERPHCRGGVPRAHALPVRPNGILPISRRPASPRAPRWNRIAGNRERGLHTLVLLDLRPEEGRFLTANEALALLREKDPEGVVVPENAPIAVAARVGRERRGGLVRPARGARHRVDFGPPMHVVIVPAPELHFEEIAALARYRGRPPVEEAVEEEGGVPVDPGGEERLGELTDAKRAEQHYVRPMVVVRGRGGRDGRQGRRG